MRSRCRAVRSGWNGGPFWILAEAVVIRVAAEAVERGVKVLYVNLDVRNSKTMKGVTDIDILTTAEMIEVKTGEFRTDEKLSGDAMTQFSRLLQIFKGTMTVVDDSGALFVPPPKFVYLFHRPTTATLRSWLLSKGVSEVRSP